MLSNEKLCIPRRSFALPLKYTNNSGVDPVVLQCYFTVSVFVSSWLVLTYNEFAFTTWGIAGAGMYLTITTATRLQVIMCRFVLFQVTTTTVGPNATIVIVTCYGRGWIEFCNKNVICR